MKLALLTVLCGPERADSTSAPLLPTGPNRGVVGDGGGRQHLEGTVRGLAWGQT